MYKVILTSKDANNEFQVLELNIKENDAYNACCQAVDYYYENYWTNSNHNIEKFNQLVKIFIEKLEIFNNEITHKVLNKDEIIKDYKSKIREKLGATDISVCEFKKLFYSEKIQYMKEIGCEVETVSFPIKTKIDKIKLLKNS